FPTSRLTYFNWLDLPNFTAPVYFYAAIDDGQNPVQTSAYSDPISAPDPTPKVTGPTFIQPVASNGGHPVTFSAANHTALTIKDNFPLQITLNLWSSDG